MVPAEFSPAPATAPVADGTAPAAGGTAPALAPNLRVRPATASDAPALAAIYQHYVENTAVSFEYEAPDAAEMARRIQSISARYPYLVLEELPPVCMLAAGNDDLRILGYAYANTFKGRAAYDWSVETTIYLDADQRGHGFGSMLLEALEEALRQQGILNANACIAHTRDDADPYLTNASEGFHAKHGYSMIGTFHDSGFKFNRWYDMVWMEKMLGDHTATPQRPDNL